VHFKEKVESGQYDFGNAILEPLEKFWNNDHYRNLRISSQQGDVCLMPECKNCANLMSPNDIRSHIMQWDEDKLTRDGEELFAKGDLEGAREAFSQAIALNPEYAHAYNNLGVVYWKSGDHDNALANFHKALILDPDDPDAVLNLSEMLLSQEKIHEAAHVLERYLHAHPESSAAKDMLYIIKAEHDGEKASENHPAGPLVSVIVPTHNRPDMLKEALESILSQTYPNFEIIVVNDCGRDVGELVHSLNRMDNITHVRHGINRGLAAARNTGIKLARGKYIAYLDDDDIFYPDHLETLVGCLEQNRYQVAYTDAYRAHQVYQDGSYQITERDTPYSIDFSKDLLLSQNISPVNCFMHTRQCIDEVGLFDEDFHAHEDWELWVRISRKHDFIHIKKVTTEFRWRVDGSTMTSSSQREFLRTMEEIFKRYQSDAQDKPIVVQAQRSSLLHLSRLVAQEERPLKCSIIIPVFNKVEYTKQCLETLHANTPGDFYEVIIVDNASSDGTADFLATLGGNVKVITNDKNTGFAHACNQGARAACGKYLVFLNNDTIPHKGWLDALINAKKSSDDIGVVGSKLLFPDGTIQHAGVVIIPTRSGKLGSHLYWGSPGNFGPANKARDFQVVTAACMLIGADIFFTAGGFDERYVNGMEDVDLCLKVRTLGKRVYYCPNSVLTHFESKSPGRFDRVRENERLFVQVWNDRIEADNLKYLFEDGFRAEYVNGKTTWVYHEELFDKLLSVIISTHNSLALLRRAIESIKACASIPVEIIVVDNGSTDDTEDYLKTVPDVQAVFLNDRTGPEECIYAGLERAKGGYIASVSPEVLVTPGWDTQCILGFKGNTGAVSATVYSYDDLLSFKDIIRDPSKAEVDLNYFSSLLGRWNNNKCEKGSLDLRCVMIKRDTIEKIATSGGSKNACIGDLSLRIKEAGYEVVRAQGSLVYTRGLSFSGEKHEPLSPERMDSVALSLKIPLTSIIILTFNQIRFTKECLESVYQHTKIPFELILVDNGSTDGTREYLTEFARTHHNVKLILNDKNLGFAAGNNQGIRDAQGSYILLLNNDVVVTEGWLERLISHLEQSLDIGMVGPMSNAVSGAQLVEKVPYGSSMKAMQKFARSFAYDNAGKTTLIVRLVGYCLLIRKEVIGIIGGLDENYISGNFEDDDLCLRSFIAGYKNIIAHDVFIHHYGSMTFKGNAIDYRATMKRNLQYFTDKWKDIVEAKGNQYRISFTKEQQQEKLIEWGEESFSKGDLLAAARIFERALIFNGTNSRALNDLGVVEWQIGHSMSALNIFQTALSINPKDPDALGNLVQVITETGRFDLLKPELLNLVRKAQPTNPDIDNLLCAHLSTASTI